MARTLRINPLVQPTGTFRERVKIKFHVLAEGLRSINQSQFVRTVMSPIHRLHKKMEVDNLRRNGFEAVWREVGDLLARDNGNLDAYLRESDIYSTVANLLTRLKAMDGSIATAKKILDVTAMTGGVAKHILDNSSGDAVVYANEISPRMMKKRDATLEEHIRNGRCRPISIDLSKPNLAGDTPSLKGFDLILWWGSFQLVAGRKMSIDNAFDMLREGGHLVLIDVYPFNLAELGRKLGDDKAKRLAYISKPFDMGKDVKDLVVRQWGLRAIAERMTRAIAGSEVGQPRPVEIIEFGERFEPEAFTEMRCLCFTRPRTSKTERMRVLRPEPESERIHA